VRDFLYFRQTRKVYYSTQRSGQEKDDLQSPTHSSVGRALTAVVFVVSCGGHGSVQQPGMDAVAGGGRGARQWLGPFVSATFKPFLREQVEGK
jgi:hypothetical protein